MSSGNGAPPSKEELARWEAAARKDNPSYWDSKTLVAVFDALHEAIKERDTVENQCADHQRGENDALNAVAKAHYEIARLRAAINDAIDHMVQRNDSKAFEVLEKAV